VIKDDTLREYRLERPTLVVGRYLIVDLLEHSQTQKVDNLYYICIEFVQATAIPMKHFEVVLSPTEKKKEHKLQFIPDKKIQ